jgi:hypothetical protein
MNGVLHVIAVGGLAALESRWSDKYPWLGDFIWGMLGLGLLILLIYLFKPGGATGASVDFTISVHGEEVDFKGRFPPTAEGMVADFLVNDCKIEGPYSVTGRWEEGRLVVAVRGENAKPLEQRIRNFLKLNIKPQSAETS